MGRTKAANNRGRSLPDLTAHARSAMPALREVVDALQVAEVVVVAADAAGTTLLLARLAVASSVFRIRLRLIARISRAHKR